ncbi:hypothetical protein DPV78_011774 [Talaromyces pinophilus]|nr:hypothetical protein DPV78_011774 [Talaromyces pinophilus]
MATEKLETKTHSDYTVGWVCALSKEQTAATAMLDERHGDLPNPHHDSNTYTLGSIDKHNVVIACLPEGRYGTNAAANVVTLLAGTFPSVRSCLMVGIGGGIPSNKVRLGDVVVGKPEGQFPGVVQWDMGRTKQGGEFERTGALDNPPKALLTALAKLKTDNELNGSKIPEYLNEFKNRYPKAVEKYLRSDSLVDILFKASYDHVTPVKPDKNAKAEDVQEMKLTLNEIAVSQKQYAIFEWLSPLSPSARHFENQKKRVKHTGTWLLNDPKFLDWSSKIAECQLLCCYGDPGAGKTIISPSSIQIFLTARPHVQESVQEYFKGEHSITVKAHESDIRLFIENEIGGPNDIESKAMDERLRMDILEKVVHSAKGIFLLPTLQICAVLQATTLRDREEALKELPSNLGEAFTGTMTRIQQQPVALSERAAKIIAWIHLAERPFTVNELLCSLAIQDSDTYFNLREYLLANCTNYSVSLRLLYGVIYGYRFSEKQLDDALPAHIAAFFGLREIILHLSSTLLNLDMEDVHGRTPLSWAAENGYEGVVKVLIEKGAVRDLVDKNGRTPLSWAAENRREAVVKVLIEKGAAVDSVYKSGRTPLSWAARWGNKTVVKVLIEKGAVVDLVDKNGRTPLSWAARRGHEGVVKVLIEKGAAVESVDSEYGRTPLSWAVVN